MIAHKNKRKPVVEDIVITQEKMDELNSEVRRKSTSSKPAIIRKYAGGTCAYCGDIPTKKLKYDIGYGDKLVEWYCGKCFERWLN
jgi:hypothetical protein